MVVLSPIAWPLGKVLDYVLGSAEVRSLIPLPLLPAPAASDRLTSAAAAAAAAPRPSACCVTRRRSSHRATSAASLFFAERPVQARTAQSDDRPPRRGAGIMRIHKTVGPAPPSDQGPWHGPNQPMWPIVRCPFYAISSLHHCGRPDLANSLVCFRCVVSLSPRAASSHMTRRRSSPALWTSAPRPHRRA